MRYGCFIGRPTIVGRTEKHCFPAGEESLDADVHSANGLV